MMEAESIVTAFICDELLRGDEQVSFAPDGSLISTGILDSLALLKLLLFLEEHFHFKIADGEVNPTNFETVNRIKAFIDTKTARAMAS
jgi:acyl carrier protein